MLDIHIAFNVLFVFRLSAETDTKMNWHIKYKEKSERKKWNWNGKLLLFRSYQDPFIDSTVNFLRVWSQQKQQQKMVTIYNYVLQIKPRSKTKTKTSPYTAGDYNNTCFSSGNNKLKFVFLFLTLYLSFLFSFNSSHAVRSTFRPAEEPNIMVSGYFHSVSRYSLQVHGYFTQVYGYFHHVFGYVPQISGYFPIPQFISP